MKADSKLGLLLLCGLALTACNSGVGYTAADGQIYQEPIYLDKASAEDFEQHMVVVKGKKGNELKVVICHVPPGNPDNRHTISISENAVDAHMNHGHNKKHADRERDYLGECRDGSDDSGGDGSGDDGSSGGTDGGTDGSTDGGTDSGSGDGGSTGGTDGSSGGTDSGSGDAGSAPVCTSYPITDRDQNCDGADDLTGDQLY